MRTVKEIVAVGSGLQEGLTQWAAELKKAVLVSAYRHGDWFSSTRLLSLRADIEYE